VLNSNFNLVCDLIQSLSDDSLGNSKKKSSILETLGQPRKKEMKKKDSVPWWISEEDSDDGGMLGSSGSIVKIQNALQLMGGTGENMHTEKMPLQTSNGIAISLSRDSLETNVVASGPNQSITGVGLDTLEEQEEKEVFFAKLEQEASSTIDYSRLNKELDSNDSVILAPFVRWTMNKRTVFSLTLIFFILVVLLDSQDSTTELQKTVETSDVALGEHYLPQEVSGIEMKETGTSYGQTTSDIEALRQAYHHVDQSLEDTDEQKIHDSAMAISKCLLESVTQNNDIYSKNVSTTESDLPTVEELMRPIKGDSYNARRFDLEPESPVKQTGSTGNELVNHLPFKEHQNNTVWETNLLEKSNKDESIFLQMGANKSNLQRVTEKEIQTSEVQPDVLNEKMVEDCLLSQGRKTNQHLPFSPVKSCERELYLLRRAQVAEEDLNRARDLIQQLTSTVSQKEKEMETKIQELKTQHEKELSQWGQENYVLQSKLRSMEELTKEKRWIHHTATVPVTEEKLSQIQKEIEDQEVIIQGYQQENEKLYKQMKELQIQNKKNEEQMFKENQCLMSELIALREKIEKINIQSRIVQDSEPPRNQSFTELISELQAAQKEENKLQEEIKRLKQDKQALEVDLGQAKKERDLAKVQIASTSGEKSYEFKVMEESYKQEILHLKRRLQWYAENQDLLDKDAARLKDAREEIEKLKLEVEKLRAEAGDQCVQQKKRLKDRAADAKRIQDLERQIREMEGILKRRYPNSLPALMFAAAAAEKTNDLSAKTNTIDFLERRIKKLETELEGKDDEAKKSLRAMEQQFQKIKIQYEQRLAELEQLLAYKFMSELPKPNVDKANSTKLEEELQNLKKSHQITVKNLETEIENLKSQNSELKLRSKKDNKDLKLTDSQMKEGNTKDRLLKLNQELVTKNKEIRDLTKTVEKLQKERMMMLSDNNLRNKTDNKENSQEILKKNTLATDKRNSSNSEPFLGIFHDDRIYQPHTFSDPNISEVLQENAQLKEELEKLSLEMNQQRVKSQATLAYSENNIRRIQEDTAEYIASLKASHQREVENILCQYAKEHSASKVAELNSRISTQEILIKHLQEQISEHQRHQEALLVSQMREELLQKEVAKLLEELREAKESQSPEMKHFLCLEKKIKHIETRHAEREQELQKATQLTQHITEARQTHEAEKWRKLAQRKNQELEKFRVELDSILDVLRELQKQGVVIPAPNSSGFSVTENCWKT
uniref:Centrosomal protein of 162 kDa n=1 Tax=Anser cygnoides TaxID=8845 RepID=A0A8B9DZW1_ANSCY